MKGTKGLRLAAMGVVAFLFLSGWASAATDEELAQGLYDQAKASHEASRPYWVSEPDTAKGHLDEALSTLSQLVSTYPNTKAGMMGMRYALQVCEGKAYVDLFSELKNPKDRVIRQYAPKLGMIEYRVWGGDFVNQPIYAVARHELMKRYIGLREYDKALEQFQATQKAFPSSAEMPGMRFSLAKMYVAMNKRDDAIAEFQGIVDSYSTNIRDQVLSTKEDEYTPMVRLLAQARLHKGELLIVGGKRNEGRDALAAVTNLYPGTEEAQRAQELLDKYPAE